MFSFVFLAFYEFSIISRDYARRIREVIIDILKKDFFSEKLLWNRTLVPLYLIRSYNCLALYIGVFMFVLYH